MTYYMIQQVRHGNLLALPDELRLPMVVRIWRKTSWVTRIAALVGVLVLIGGVYVYVVFSVARRVPDGTAVVSSMTRLVYQIYWRAEPRSWSKGKPVHRRTHQRLQRLRRGT